MSELKPCPWCDSVKLFDSENEVMCRNCGAHGPKSFDDESERTSVELWNTRHIDPRIDRLEALINLLISESKSLLNCYEDMDLDMQFCKRDLKDAIGKAEATKGNKS